MTGPDKICDLFVEIFGTYNFRDHMGKLNCETNNVEVGTLRYIQYSGMYTEVYTMFW